MRNTNEKIDVDNMILNQRVTTENTLKKDEAIDKCLLLGDKFLSLYKELFSTSQTELNPKLIQQMQYYYDFARKIKIEGYKKVISSIALYDWFFLKGSSIDSLFEDEIGEEIPTYADFSQFEISLAVTIAIARTNNIAVIVSPSVYATQGDLAELRTECEKIKFTAVETTERDPNKPDYGLNQPGGGETENVTLEASTYTGTAEVTLIMNNKQYDAANMTAKEDAATDGTMIIQEEK